MLILVAQVYHDVDYSENVNYYTYHSNCILKTLQSEISSFESIGTPLLSIH